MDNKNYLIEKKVRKILSRVSRESCDELALTEDLFNAGILDSFSIIEFIIALEKEGELTISQELLIPQNLWSIEAICAMLKRLGFKY
jgi:acyl carrier protein